jgi:release factor glutamine methyltransferase
MIADIGTGSGCIAVSLAKYLPNVSVTGIDSSPEAIKIAKKNAERHKVNDRCRFVAGNWLEPLKEKVDIIVSNPPYIPSAVIDTLQPEVKNWEPREALDGGKDGLDFIQKLISEVPNHLILKGLLVFEFGFDQAIRIGSLAEDKFKKIDIQRDYNGLERIFIGQV